MFAIPNTTAFLFVFAINVALIVITVVIHYESIYWLAFNRKMVAMRSRSRLVLSLLYLIVSHSVEVACWAIGYALIDRIPLAGAFDGAETLRFLDYLYFSFTSYTTVGFGDITPIGHIRFTSNAESLVGLVLVAWTASYLLFVMQQCWQRERERMIDRSGETE